MHPVLLRFGIGDHTVRLLSYPVFVLMGATVCAALFVVLAGRRGLARDDSVTLVAVSGVAAIIGARVSQLADSATGGAPSTASAGYSLIGGIVAAAAVAWWFARRRGLDPWRLADDAAPGIAFGVALAKTGCLLEGCCFGVPCAAPWALQFPVGSAAWSWQVANDVVSPLGIALPTWPTYALDIGVAVVLGAIATALRARSSVRPGVAFLTLAVGYGTVRMLGNTVRAQQYGLAGLIIGGSAVATAAALLVARMRAGAATAHEAGTASRSHARP